MEIALSYTKLSGNTCINKAGRQGIQLRSVKPVFLQIELKYLYGILYIAFLYIRLLSPKILKNEKVLNKYQRVGFFYTPLSIQLALQPKTPLIASLFFMGYGIQIVNSFSLFSQCPVCNALCVAMTIYIPELKFSCSGSRG